MEGWLVVLLLVTLLQLADLRTDLNLVEEERGGGRFEQLRLAMDSAQQMGDHPHHNCCSILSCFRFQKQSNSLFKQGPIVSEIYGQKSIEDNWDINLALLPPMGPITSPIFQTGDISN